MITHYIIITPILHSLINLLDPRQVIPLFIIVWLIVLYFINLQIMITFIITWIFEIFMSFGNIFRFDFNLGHYVQECIECIQHDGSEVLLDVNFGSAWVLTLEVVFELLFLLLSFLLALFYLYNVFFIFN